MNTVTFVALILGVLISLGSLVSLVVAFIAVRDDVEARSWVTTAAVAIAVGVTLFACGTLEAFGFIPSFFNGPSFDGPKRDTRTYESPPPAPSAEPRDVVDEAKKEHEDALKEFEKAGP